MTKITNTYVLDKAKMSVLLLIMLFTCPLAFAQSEPETAKPLTDMEVVRIRGEKRCVSKFGRSENI